MVKLLLKLNANPDLATFDDWNTPLHLAVIVGNKSVINLLIDFGADETLLNKYGSLAWEGINSKFEWEKRYGKPKKKKVFTYSKIKKKFCYE